MARIRVPKPLILLLQEVEPEKFLPLLGKYGATDSKGRYFHWNDFNWRVKSGDNELAAWIATKIARKAITKNFPLLQAEGDHCFSYCVPDSLFAQLYAIDTMTGGSRENSNSILGSSPPKNPYLVKSLMQEEAITSS